MSTTTYYKRNTSEFWEASELVPDENTVFIAEDTGVCKRGDGVHVWKDLPDPNEAGGNEAADEAAEA